MQVVATSFDQQVRATFPTGQIPVTGSSAAMSTLTAIVIGFVDQCGYQVVLDIADQYPDPLYGWLNPTAASAVGEISALPDGLRCAELSTLGLGPKRAVDYWFLWGAPAPMDADRNEIPCETIWSDVEKYMPPSGY